MARYGCHHDGILEKDQEYAWHERTARFTISADPMKYKRIMLKLSGESLSKEGSGQGIHQPTLIKIAKDIADVAAKEIQVVIVVGGGNIWRFRDTSDSGIERTASDTMGMIATIMNGVALQASLESLGVFCRVASAIQVPQVAEPYIRRRVIRHLEKGRIVICAGGTGNPFFTTDSAAALRALELDCDVVLKATNVEGIYDKDPNKFPDATLYKELTYTEALEKHLDVMDQAAFSLCQDQNLPIRVFNFNVEGNLMKAAMGEEIGTLVHG
jgi:uridylate kinase